MAGKLTPSRRRAMRTAHARRAWHCTCGKIVHGNGGSASHEVMHVNRGDGHHFITEDDFNRRRTALAENASRTNGGGDG